MNTRIKLIALAVLLSTPSNSYAVRFWKDSVPVGTFGTSTNWSAVSAAGTDNGGAPLAGEPARIAHTSGVAHAVSVIGNTPSLGLLSIDLTGPGATTNTLTLSNHFTLTAAGIYVGGHNGSGFTSGRGTLTQSAGTITASPGNDLYIGLGAGSTGIYNLSGGALNANLSTVVGSGGTGTFNHSGGTHTLVAEAIGGALLVGYLAGGNGTYNLSSTGQLISNKNEIIGVDGVGQLVQTGGTNTIGDTFNMYLGLNSGSQGTYNLSAGTLSGFNQIVGYSGVGQFNQSGGTNNVANLVIGDRATGQGAYAISGGGLAVSNNAVVGLLGTASMNITGTGSAYITNDLAINNTSNVTLNGGTLRVNTVSAGLNRLIFQSGTLQLGGSQRDLTTDSTIAAFFGASPVIPAGKGLTIEGTTTLGSSLGAGARVQGGTFRTDGIFYVGGLGNGFSGTHFVEQGGKSNHGNYRLGDFSGSDGTTIVDGLGSMLTTGVLEMGAIGYGRIYIRNGGTAVSSALEMGDRAGGSGGNIALLTGAGTSWTIAGLCQVGRLTTGSMTVEQGARLHVGGELRIGRGSSVTLDGGTVRLDTLVFESSGVGAQGVFNYDSGVIEFAGNRNVGVDETIERFFGTTPMLTYGNGLTVEGAATLTKPLNIDGGTFKTNGLTIGAGGNLLFQSGVLEVGSGGITGLAQLNIPTNGEFRAVGTQTVRVVGTAGSTITPNGVLILGDFNAVNGFYTNGTVNIGTNTLAIADANDAVFDSAAYVTLGNGASPGQLDALNGLTLNFGGNITGFGEVFTSNAIFTPLINNGHITGASPAQRITLPGYVKGSERSTT